MHDSMQETKQTLSGSGDGQSRSDVAIIASDADAANKYMAGLGRKVKEMAGKMREKSVPETVRNTTNKVADRLEGAGRYLEEGKFKHLPHDLVTLVRKHPVQSFLAVASLGLFLVRRNKGKKE
jgi:hypothetical protein